MVDVRFHRFHKAPILHSNILLCNLQKATKKKREKRKPTTNIDVSSQLPCYRETKLANKMMTKKKSLFFSNPHDFEETTGLDFSMKTSEMISNTLPFVQESKTIAMKEEFNNENVIPSSCELSTKKKRWSLWRLYKCTNI